MDDAFPHVSIKSAILEISSELRRLSIDTMLLPDEIIDVIAMGDNLDSNNVYFNRFSYLLNRLFKYL